MIRLSSFDDTPELSVNSEVYTTLFQFVYFEWDANIHY